MIAAIRDVTINQGVDPRRCLMVAGGGAGGLNAAAIAAALGCATVLVPSTAGAMSACGAQFADIVAEFSISRPTNSGRFDFEGVDSALSALSRRIDEFATRLSSYGRLEREFSVEARYPFQAWDLEVPLETDRLVDAGDVRRLEDRFHEAHERTFAVAEPGQHIDCQQWNGRLVATLEKPRLVAHDGDGTRPADRRAPVTRSAYFDGFGMVDLECHVGGSLEPGAQVSGPAVVDEPTTTIVVPPGARATVTPLRNYLIETMVAR
jgi:N-methylhydantoinase A